MGFILDWKCGKLAKRMVWEKKDENLSQNETDIFSLVIFQLTIFSQL
jgi:hypothetical protein